MTNRYQLACPLRVEVTGKLICRSSGYNHEAGAKVMVKVYGRRSRSWMYDGSQQDDESVDLSDDGEIGDVSEQQVSVTERDSIESTHPIESNDGTDEPLNVSTSTTSYLGDNCKATGTSTMLNGEASPLKAFDFLQDQSAVKRRKRNYKKTSVEDSEACEESVSHNESDSLINKTVDDLNEFLASLQPAKVDDKIKESFERELKKSTEEDSAVSSDRVMYDRSRTILFNEDEDEIEVPEPDQQPEAVSEKPKAGRKINKDSTHHYNELKNIGEALKYQDELEFLTDESPVELSTETFISRFLNLVLTIEQDKEFLDYVDRHAADEVCRWCFGKRFTDHPVVTLLQCFLLTKIQPPENLPSCFERLILASLGFDEPPAIHTLSSKLARLNLVDFLEKTGGKTAQDYSLQLCLKYRDEIPSSEVTTKIIGIATQRDLDLKKGPLLYPLVERILSSDLQVMDDSSQASILLNSLISALPKQPSNEGIVKSLIMLSNEQKILAEVPADNKEMLMRCSLEFILKHIHPTTTSTADLLILYLGLLLNTIDICDPQMFDTSQIDLARKLLLDVSNSDTDSFIVCMYSLNLTHMLLGTGEELHKDEKDVLIRILKSFDEEGVSCNQAIRNRIKSALDSIL